jgi:hypothetical protein
MSPAAQKAIFVAFIFVNNNAKALPIPRKLNCRNNLLPEFCTPCVKIRLPGRSRPRQYGGESGLTPSIPINQSGWLGFRPRALLARPKVNIALFSAIFRFYHCKLIMVLYIYPAVKPFGKNNYCAFLPGNSPRPVFARSA